MTFGVKGSIRLKNDPAELLFISSAGLLRFGRIIRPAYSPYAICENMGIKVGERNCFCQRKGLRSAGIIDIMLLKIIWVYR